MSSAVFGGLGGSSMGTLGETAEIGFAVPPVELDGSAAYAAIMPRPRPSTPQSSATSSPRLLMRHNLPRGLDGRARRAPASRRRDPAAPMGLDTPLVPRGGSTTERARLLRLPTPDRLAI